MIETALAALGGGLFRLLPEVLKWFDRKDERKHELAMQDKNLAFEKLKSQSAGDLARVQTDAIIGAAEIQALIEATKAQAVQTGVKWVDALSALMRPLITFWWVIFLYTAALGFQFFALVKGGVDITSSVLELWGPGEKAIVSSIIGYWFADRSLRKGWLK